MRGWILSAMLMFPCYSHGEAADLSIDIKSMFGGVTAAGINKAIDYARYLQLKLWDLLKLFD